MSDKKPGSDLLAAFNRTAKQSAPAPAAAAPRAARARAARPARREEARPIAEAAAAGAGARKNLMYRTSPGNWVRIKHLAIADNVTVQELFHRAVSSEFERRGLPPLED